MKRISYSVLLCRLQRWTIWKGTVEWSFQELQCSEQACPQWIIPHRYNFRSDSATDCRLGMTQEYSIFSKADRLSSIFYQPNIILGREESTFDHLHVVQPCLGWLSAELEWNSVRRSWQRRHPAQESLDPRHSSLQQVCEGWCYCCSKRIFIFTKV